MRGKKMTRGEDDAIRILRNKGHSIRSIAQILGRGKSGVMRRIQRMEREGTLHKGIFDLGQVNDKTS